MLDITGRLCTINKRCDLMFEHEARVFIGRECRVIKQTKAGLIEVELVEDTRKRDSFAKYNVDIDPIYRGI